MKFTDSHKKRKMFFIILVSILILILILNNLILHLQAVPGDLENNLLVLKIFTPVALIISAAILMISGIFGPGHGSSRNKQRIEAGETKSICSIKMPPEAPGTVESTRKKCEELRNIFASAPIGIIITDLEGNITNCNNSTLTLLGYKTRVDLTGLNVFRLISYDDLKKAKESLITVVNQGYDQETYSLYKKNRTTFVGEISANLLLDRQNNPLGFVMVVQDITKRKKTENERETMITRLREKQEELERFTYTVSHDLRSPLITIKGFLGFILEDIKENNQKQLKDDIDKISMSVEKMNALLTDLLELSRIGRISGEKEMIPLNSILTEVIALLDGQIKENNVNLIFRPDLPEIYGYHNRLVQLFQNLLENAIKYKGTQKNPTIEIGVRETKFQSIFFIKDNGIGIDSYFHEKIFGLFQQVDDKTQGTGIGLTLVKKIIEIHGGRIWIESDGKGSGTSFNFTLKE